MKRFICFCFALFSLTTSIQAQDTTIQLENTALTLNVLTEGLNLPWDMVWGPDGKIWFNQRNGKIYRLDPDTKELDEIFAIPGVFEGPDNGGAHAFALHPEFPLVPFVYAHYTWERFKSKLVRYTYSITEETLKNPVIILDSIDAHDSHNGSRIQFDEDGYLYFSMGDAYNSVAPQEVDHKNGKILRMTDGGGIPDDNPYPGTLTWTYGHRNPQGLCFGRDGLLYSSEHGTQSDDEINIIERGRNYGWPLVEGFCDRVSEQQPCDSLNVREPLTVYTPTDAPGGMDYFDHPSIPEWKHSLLQVFLKDRKLEMLPLTEDGLSIDTANRGIYLQRQVGRIRDVLVSPNGRVFISTSNRETKPGQPEPDPVDDRIIELVNKDYDYPEFETVQFLGPATVFPNPASDQVFVSLGNEETKLAYELTDLQGNVIAADDDLITPNGGLWQIFLPDVGNGIYILKYISQSGIEESMRIVIARE